MAIRETGVSAEQLAFGPVPSRRLGRSLGVNNIPPKTCSYSCVYCQLGPTDGRNTGRIAFYPVEDIVNAVRTSVRNVRAAGGKIDYITFVPDGEPTLDINLGIEIGNLRDLGIKIAVITNASLLWRKDVRDDLSRADWVSVKVDTAEEDVWKAINRPAPELDFETVLDGVRKFSDEFGGFLATETLLVKGVNDDMNSVEKTARFISGLNPDKAYISIPTRPPSENWVMPPDEYTVTQSYLIFRNHIGEVELLTGYEGTEFHFTGDLEKDILSITAVHPMREDAVREMAEKSGKGWSVIENMLKAGTIRKIEYKGNEYYIRKFNILRK